MACCTIPFVLVATSSCTTVASALQPSDVAEPGRLVLPQRGDVVHVHDPTAIEQGGRFYVFSTGHGIPVRQSDDLVNWSLAGTALASDLPSWATSKVPGVEFPWAPDVAFFNGRYHLYYSLSTFGSQRSVIGLATGSTLDTTSDDYEWVDRGPVIESRPGIDDFNAIDPNVAFDAEGAPWLAWGSFWGGIKLRRLDPATGLPSHRDPSVHALAARPVEKSVEAPAIVRFGGYYYLFVSFDRCCRGADSTYRVVVGRARAITGPYLDRDETPMMQGGGTVVLASRGRIRGPGHNSILATGGRHYIVHHFYDALASGLPTLRIRPIVWDGEGWPVAPVGDDEQQAVPGNRPLP